MAARPLALHVAPHPDDEVLGCGATLCALRDAGWRVVNLACSLGRPGDADRRRAELAGSLAALGFESVVADPPERLAAGTGLAAAEDRLAGLIGAIARRLAADLVISPHPADGHHAHRVVGRAVARAAPGRRWWAWSLWRDLPRPNLYVPWDDERLAALVAALRHHAGEVDRNGYLDLPASRGRVQAVLGSERVFGFGSPAVSPSPYADLLTEAGFVGGRWRPSPPRVLERP